jgi:uridine kinase
MKGDIILIEEYHQRVARLIVQKISDKIEACSRRYIITVAGESGSGKSETGKAIQNELEANGIKTVLIGQDDYFILPPHTNAARRRQDQNWLGPQTEVKMDVMEQNLLDAVNGENAFTKPLIDYINDVILEERVDLRGVKVIIAEGTYTSLLKNVDVRIFIDRTYSNTLAHRKKRSRGTEANDPFIEQTLANEHKIIVKHKKLADIIITKDYDVVCNNKDF